MTTHAPLACDLHDTLEVACVYHYVVTLLCRDGTAVSGRAMTTETTADKVKLLIVESSIGTKQIPSVIYC